jgi:hypothetical protein
VNRPDVEKYEKLAGAATAGPWEVTGEGDWDREVGSALEYVCRGPGDYAGDSCFEEADAALIAASRTAIPELCAYIRHMEAKIELYMGESLKIAVEADAENARLKALLRIGASSAPRRAGEVTSAWGGQRRQGSDSFRRH